ncbi:MAG: hypothetical protein K9M01_04705 [Candidatus Omnitrophica bacterium]|nr:hypothetical protein [Candidatus Omnitrophota bacterium]
MKCTFCGKEMDEFQVGVTLNIKTSRLRNDDTWEEVPNMSLSSKEVLCSDCFSEFAEVLNEQVLKAKNKVEK